MSAEEAVQILQTMIENRFLFDFKEEELVALRIAVAFMIAATARSSE